jgi:hypothetical protein
MTAALPLKFQKDNLVLYKSKPARVMSAGAKTEIELPDGKKISVREKDITLLHPGPFSTFSKLENIEPGEVEEACAIFRDFRALKGRIRKRAWNPYRKSSRTGNLAEFH